MAMMRKTHSTKLARMWSSQDSRTPSVGVQRGADTLEISGRIHQSWANTYTKDLAISPLATDPNEIPTTITENLNQERAALLVTAPSWKHPACPTAGPWAQRRTRTREYSRWRGERMSWNRLCTNLDKSLRWAIEQKKPDTEGHTMHVPVCMKFKQSQINFKESEIRRVAPQGGTCGGLCDAVSVLPFSVWMSYSKQVYWHIEAYSFCKLHTEEQSFHTLEESPTLGKMAKGNREKIMRQVWGL